MKRRDLFKSLAGAVAASTVSQESTPEPAKDSSFAESTPDISISRFHVNYESTGVRFDSDGNRYGYVRRIGRFTPIELGEGGDDE